MKYRISKEFHFCASHQLNGLPEDHPCSRHHGHNYVIIVEFGANVLNDVGFVVDYRELNPIKEFVDNHLDHRHLNEVLPMQPSAENIARWFAENVVETMLSHTHRPRVKIVSVTVKETPKTAATFVL